MEGVGSQSQIRSGSLRLIFLRYTKDSKQLQPGILFGVHSRSKVSEMLSSWSTAWCRRCSSRRQRGRCSNSLPDEIFQDRLLNHPGTGGARLLWQEMLGRLAIVLTGLSAANVAPELTVDSIACPPARLGPMPPVVVRKQPPRPRPRQTRARRGARTLTPVRRRVGLARPYPGVRASSSYRLAPGPTGRTAPLA